jgi:hypothetical protein
MFASQKKFFLCSMIQMKKKKNHGYPQGAGGAGNLL